jgi:hypothetical protein
LPLISSEVTVLRSAWKAMSSRSSLEVMATEIDPLWPKVLPISVSVRAGTRAVIGSVTDSSAVQSISRTATR